MADSPRKDIHNSDVPVLCRSCEARHQGLCGALSPEQLTKLSRTTRKEQLQAGQTFRNGEDENESCANIMTGVVKCSKIMADGRQQIVGLRFAPDFIGRTTNNGLSELEIEAATDVKICAFPRRAIAQLISEVPDLEHRLLQQVARELDEARDWMLTLGRKTATERVASFLLLLAQNIDPEQSKDIEHVVFDLPISRADIADFLGLTTETVSRQITKLRKAEIIALESNRHVTVLDLDRLETTSKGE